MMKKTSFSQLDLFTDNKKIEDKFSALEKETHIQETMLSIKNKYGKNAVIKGMNLQDGATTIDRNKQIGGHKA